MLQKFGRRFLALLLAVIMIGSMLPADVIAAELDSHDHSQHTSTPVTDSESVDNSDIITDTDVPDKLLSVDVSGIYISDDNSGYDGPVEAGKSYKYSSAESGSITSKGTKVTITIKNNTDKKVIISFDFAKSGDGTYDSKLNSSPYTTSELDPGGSVSFSIQGGSKWSGDRSSNLTLSNFKITEVVDNPTVTIEFDSNLGGVTVGGTAVNSGTVQEVSKGSSIELAATGSNTFLGWIDGDGTILSTSSSFTLSPKANMVVKPAFAQQGGDPWFLIGATTQQSYFDGTSIMGADILGTRIYYHTIAGSLMAKGLNEAVALATASGSKNIVLMNNATLTAGTYTIPSGITMLIPFDTANSLFTTSAVSTGTYATPTAYRTLTMADGAKLMVSGAVSVSGKQIYASGDAAKTPYGGAPSGPVGMVKMEGNSSITVNNGGALYAYGYVTGSGSVTAKSGANIHEMFQIADFRGGSQSIDMKNNVFPISQYYLQNIEVPLTLEYGAKEYAYATIYMNGAAFASSTLFFASSGAMFNITKGAVTKWYDGTTDRLRVETDGTMVVSPIDMDVGGTGLNSSDFVLGINGNITIRAKNGASLTINQDVAMQPGSEIIIDEGAYCTVSEGKNMYVYDADQWGNYTSHIAAKFYPVAYAPGKTYTRTEADMKDVSILVNGTVDATKGFVYTTIGGANIYSTGTGIVNITAGTKKVTYQFDQSTGTYIEIPIVPAMLKNVDGTYTDPSKISASGTTYTYKDGKWVPKCNECVSGGAATCGKAETCKYCGYEINPATGNHDWNAATCTDPKTCKVCGATEGTANGHKKQTVTGTAPDCTNPGLTDGTICSVCGDWIKKQEPIDALGHEPGEEKTENIVVPNCDTDGSHDVVTYCMVCGKEASRQTVKDPATGHSYGEWQTVNDSTCSQEGTKKQVCGTCGDEVTETIAKKPHTPDEEHPATCTTAQICTVCEGVVIAALGHTPGDAVHENLDSDTGVYESVVYCTVCKEEVSRITIIPGVEQSHTGLEHLPIQNPTCTDTGLTAGARCTDVNCPVCHGTYEMERDVIPALGHTLEGSVVTYAWNADYTECTATGLCSRCDNSHSVSTTNISAEKHDATCETAGYTIYTATFAEDTYVAAKSEEVAGDAALGHVYNDPTYVWSEDFSTCTATSICAHDATHVRTETVNTSSVVTSPSCDVAGTITYSADFKQIWAVDQEKTLPGDAATGHTWVISSVSWMDNNVGCKVSLHCNNCSTTDTKTAGATSVVTAATCTQPGNITYTATFLPELGIPAQTKDVVIDPLGHEWGDVDYSWGEGYLTCTATRTCVRGCQESETVETTSSGNATCTNPGTMTYTAVFVNTAFGRKTETEVQNALGHTLEKVEAKAPTCIAQGNNEYYKCTTCGHFYKDVNGETETYEIAEILGMIDHSYSKYVSDGNATCVADGTKTAVCDTDGCNATDTVADINSKLGHTYDNGVVTKDPTCTEKGVMTYTCSVCTVGTEGHIYTEDVAALGHNMTAVGYNAPACMEEGNNAYYVCGRCNGVFKDEKGNTVTTVEAEKIAATGHNYNAVVTDPTCTEKGYTTHTCQNNCGSSYVDSYVDSLGHKYDNGVITTDPKCEEKGVKTFTCQNDKSHTYTEDVDALGHTYNPVVTKPTCLEQGYTTYTCKNGCGDSYVQDYVDALGHKDINTDHVCDNGCGIYQGQHTDRTTDNDHLCDYGCGQQIGDHEYIDGLCNCGHVQDLKVSLVITAPGADDQVIPSSTIKYGDAYSAVLDFSAFGACYTMQSIQIVVGGVAIPSTNYRFNSVNNELEIDGQYVVGDIQITIIATQRHEIGDVRVIEYIAPTCTENGEIKQAIYCSKCDSVYFQFSTPVTATGHNYFSTYTDPTFQADGYYTYTCGKCNDSYIVEDLGSKLTVVATIGDTKFESLEDAIAAAKQGDVIILHTQVAIEGNVNWDLSGITLRIAALDNEYGLVVRGNLTINGGNFVATGVYGIGVTATGTLTINNGTFGVNDNDYLIGSYGTTVINGGKFLGQYNCVNAFAGITTINGGIFSTEEKDFTGAFESEDVMADTENGAVLVVSGGTFSKDVSLYVADGCCIKLSNGVYTVAQHSAGGVQIENVVAPNCVDNGSHDEVTYCVHCGEQMSRQTVVDSALGHTEVVDAAKAPTCTETGLTEGKHCSVCSTILVSQNEVPATGHSYDSGVVTTNPTCTTKGVKTFTCSVCNEETQGHTYTEEVDALGHSYDNGVVTTAPTCTEKGVKTYTCSVCDAATQGHTYTEDVNARGHNMTHIGRIEPGCTTVGNNEYYKCGRCNNLYKDEKGETLTTIENEILPAAGHTEVVDAAKDPTCTETGLTEGKHCSVCGVETLAQTVIPASGHSYDKGVITTDPTCTEKGVKTYTCSACAAGTEGHTKTEAVSALGHTEIVDPFKAPTCTETGLTEGKHCSVCGVETLAQTVIPANGHTEVIDAAKAPSCVATGLTEGKHCSVCGDTLVGQEVIAPTGHKAGSAVNENIVKPTCTVVGSHDEVVYCTVCNDEISRTNKTDAALDHKQDVILPAKAPTCTSTGLTEGKRCSVCNEVVVPQTRVDMLDHTEVTDAAVESTCTATGWTEGKHCSVCNTVIVPQTVVEKKSHALKVVKTDDAGCTTNGTIYKECTNCTHKETEVILAKGHTNKELPAIAPTCTGAGWTAGVQCSVCGEITTERTEIPAKGHIYTSVVTAPTCTERGYTTHTCSVCGVKKTDTYVDFIPHTEVIVAAKAPTCTETGLTEGKKCSVCGETLVEQRVVAVKPHTEVIDPAIAATCTQTGMSEGRHCSVCNTVIVEQTETPAKGHTGITVPSVVPSCDKSGWTEGVKCVDCDLILTAPNEIPALGHVWDSGRITTQPTCVENGVKTYTCSVCGGTKKEAVDALGHDLIHHAAQHPTNYSFGWSDYDTCSRCNHTTYYVIPALGEPSISTFDDFMKNLKVLEEYANTYAKENPGKDPMVLLIKYIRTGVDRYNSGSWNIMAGYEDEGFAEYVKRREEANNKNAYGDAWVDVTGLKNIEYFVLPNGDKVDFGHMFGTIDISYHNINSVNHADVAGWAGDLVDLLSTVDRHNVSGTFDEMVSTISKNHLNHAIAGESDQFGQTDMYGDLDGFYVMQKLTAQDYENGMLYKIFEAYFTDKLTTEQRAAFFLKNRLGGVTGRNDIRDAVFNEYVGNSVIATLEGTREFNAQDLSDLRKACCYAFADYLWKLAGDYVEWTENQYYDVYSSEKSTLAPGVTQEIYKGTTADGKNTVFYVATADLNNPYISIYANYKDNDPNKGWGMQRVLDQANAAQNKHSDPNSEYYIPNYNVIAAINGAGYNMSTGEPGGLLIMGGVEYHAPNSNGFFGILKDGSAVIGTTEEYYALKEQGLVMEGIAGFGAILVKDGKVAVSHTETYTNDRASRTAVGITKTGKVVFMVMDGRQEPTSCGGSMQEIARVMLEAGCEIAVNLDGGGSSTYVARQEGDDELTVVSTPSDGFQRSVSTSLIIVSTAPSSTAFDHAVLDSDVKHMTIGAQVQMSASGVSATGNPAVIPEGAYWAVSDKSIATISANGLLTAVENGTVEVRLMLGNEIIGSRTMYVVIPDAVYFTKQSMNAVYGESTLLPVAALYEGKPVAIVESDVIFTLSNAGGVMDKWSFIGNDASGIRATKVTAHLVNNDEATCGTINIALYGKNEASFDFENSIGGDRELSWDRLVSNSTTVDNVTYYAIDVDKNMVTTYTFGIDMTKIPMPEKLTDLIYMLPGADVDGNNSAWSFLLQLAERVSVLTEVKPVIQFDPNMDVDYSELSILCDYFNLESAEFDEKTNKLTLSLRWKDQTQAIDPDTANPICILSGIKLTPKDGASWDSKDRLTVVNVGEIGYDIYLRANALYSFSQKPENQEKYSLYPFVNPNDPSESGGHFTDVYKTFRDEYTLSKGLKDGWVYEDGGYAFYENGVRYVGIRKVGAFYYDFGETGINIGQTKFSGIFTINGINHYAKDGILTPGWVVVGDEQYCFDENGKGYDGKYVVDEVEIVFDNGLMIGGYTGFIKKSDGKTYYYSNGNMTRGWIYVDGNLYHFNTDNGTMTTGTHVIPDDEARAKGAYYDFADDGRTLRGYFNPSGYYYWAGLPLRNGWVKNGADLDPDAWYHTNDNGHFSTSSGTASFKLTLNGVVYNAVLIEYDGVVYTFDDKTGKLLLGSMVLEDGKWYYYWAGQPVNDGWFIFNDETYYAYPDGHLATGSTTIDGVNYMFTQHGVLVQDGVLMNATITPDYKRMTITIRNADLSLTSVRIAVWAKNLGQAASLIWVDAEPNGEGSWKVTFPLCQFELKNAEVFELHAYGPDGLVVNTTVNVPKTADHAYSNDWDTTCNRCGEERVVVENEWEETVAMHRLYNPNSGEHFYTGSVEERDNLVAAGWVYEGVAWNAPVKSGAPVYRLYNPNSGDHHYTMSQVEVDNLVAVGWIYEGVAWNSPAPENPLSVAQFRLYNPNAVSGIHHYTSSKEERDFLVSLGWVYEGIGWYGLLK